MAHLTRPAMISGVSAGSISESAVGHRGYVDAQSGYILIGMT